MAKYTYRPNGMPIIGVVGGAESAVAYDDGDAIPTLDRRRSSAWAGPGGPAPRCKEGVMDDYHPDRDAQREEGTW